MHHSPHLDSEPLSALNSLGGEPVAGSGFENEAPEQEFPYTGDGQRGLSHASDSN